MASGTMAYSRGVFGTVVMMERVTTAFAVERDDDMTTFTLWICWKHTMDITYRKVKIGTGLIGVLDERESA
jgi:hypothetical protein